MQEIIYAKESELELIQRITGVGDVYLSNCLQYIDSECFTTQLGKDWFHTVCSLHRKKETIDLLSIILESAKLGLKTTREEYIGIGVRPNISLDDPTYIAVYLLEVKRRRELYSKCLMMSEKVLDVTNSVESISEELKKAADASEVQEAAYVSIQSTGNSLLRDCQNLIDGTFQPGMPCGFRYIDKKGGLQLSDLNIVAGCTSAGKTSLTLAMALGVAKNGVPVAIYSLEMSLKQLTARLASMESGVSSSRILSKPLEYNEMDSLCATVAQLSSYPIYFDEKCTTDISVIERSIRSLAFHNGVKLAVIDYVQLLTGREREKRDRIAAAANKLKALARELDICIILVSQLARPGGGEQPIPRLAQLKESGDLENAADNVYLIYRPEWFVGKKLQYPDMTENWSRYSTNGTGLLIQAKGRNTSLGECLLGFDGLTTHYYDINQDDYLCGSSTQAQPPINETVAF